MGLLDQRVDARLISWVLPDSCVQGLPHPAVGPACFFTVSPRVCWLFFVVVNLIVRIVV